MSELIRRAVNAGLSRKGLLDEAAHLGGLLEAERAKVAALEASEAKLGEQVCMALGEVAMLEREGAERLALLANICCGGAWDAGAAEARVALLREAMRLARSYIVNLPCTSSSAKAEAALTAALEAP